MVQFESFENGIKVNGTTIMSVVDGMGSFTKMATQILSDNELTEIVADENTWYSQQNWLNAFRQISEKIGQNTLKQIGQKIPENAVFPPDVDNIEKGLRSIDIAYHMNHAKAGGDILFDPSRDPQMLEGIGHYNVLDDRLSDSSVVLRCENPYPCNFDSGIISTIAKRFEITARVTHVDGSCRNSGDQFCEYEVTW